MADFVLVHGAWLGGWCWRHVVSALVGAGHRAHALTLTGLGERVHLSSRGVDLETHVMDVINAIEAEEAQSPVLVVHSYAGMLGTAVADRMPFRLQHLVYVDAVIPESGDSWSSAHSSDIRAARTAAALASPDLCFPAPSSSLFGLSADDREWVERRVSRQPLGTYTAVLNFSPDRVASVPRTYISCIDPALATIDATRSRLHDDLVWNGVWSGGSGARLVLLETGHLPMLSAAGELTQILMDCAKLTPA